MRNRFLLLFWLGWLIPVWSYQAVGTDSTCDIMTWNLRDFPQSGNQTVTELVQIILDLDVDLIAVQEIASVTAFDDLNKALPEWNGILSGDTYFDGTYHKTGILFKKSLVTVHSHQLIFENNFNFPRPPLELNLTVNEQNYIFDFNLIVLHLKAYSDEASEMRRRNAIQQLKEYVDQQVNYTRERDFIIAGDFNDELDDPQPTPNVFTSILQAPDDYTFLTLPLAGISGSYIFSSTPSLIDHILISGNATDEYGAAGTTNVLYLDSSLPNYTDIISDHRPVLAQFGFENQATPTPIVPIANIQNQFSEMEGQIVTVRGVVTLGVGRLTPSYTSVYLQDQSGAGINIFKYGVVLEEFVRGNRVEVTGDIYNYNGLHEIRLHSSRKLAENEPLPTPRKIRTVEIPPLTGQGQRVVTTGRIQSKSESGGSVTLYLNDGSGAGKIYADADAGLNLSAFHVNNTVRVVGVKSVYSNEGEILLAYPEDITRDSETSVTDDSKESPKKFRLLGNFPNPFNAVTTIQYELPQPARISIRIFNMQGQAVATLLQRHQKAGHHQITWDSANAPGGIYLLQIQADNYRQTCKMLLLK